MRKVFEVYWPEGMARAELTDTMLTDAINGRWGYSPHGEAFRYQAVELNADKVQAAVAANGDNPTKERDFGDGTALPAGCICAPSSVNKHCFVGNPRCPVHHPPEDPPVTKEQVQDMFFEHSKYVHGDNLTKEQVEIAINVAFDAHSSQHERERGARFDNALGVRRIFVTKGKVKGMIAEESTRTARNRGRIDRALYVTKEQVQEAVDALRVDVAKGRIAHGDQHERDGNQAVNILLNHEVKYAHEPKHFTDSDGTYLMEQLVPTHYDGGDRVRLTKENGSTIESIPQGGDALRGKGPTKVCPVCGAIRVGIRGKCPGEPCRMVCPTCLQERMDNISNVVDDAYGKASRDA